MKESIDPKLVTLFLILGVVITVIISNLPGCSSTPSKADKIIGLYLRDYQLEYHNDTLRIYDQDRLVGMATDTALNFGRFIDSTILKDNQ
jgi:hypothetical protein